MKKAAQKTASQIRMLFKNKVFRLGLIGLSIYLAFCIGFIVNEQQNRRQALKATTEDTNQASQILGLNNDSITSEDTQKDTTPQQNNNPAATGTKPSTSKDITASSIAADQADAAAKELSRCIDLELKEWQSFSAKQQTAWDYKNLKHDEYYSACTGNLITRVEFNDLMTKTYNLANDKIRTAYQTYYDTMISNKCTNVKSMPALDYWRYW